MFKFTNPLAALVAAAALATFNSAALAADPAAPASGAAISKSDAKGMKTQSEAQYKARKNVAEANEDLNRGDCKTALEGSAKRACEKSAKAAAKSDKAAAKAVHEIEEKKIKDAAK